MDIPFGMSETEWNKFCDSHKCRYGNYCSFIIGLCPKCKEDIERWTQEHISKIPKVNRMIDKEQERKSISVSLRRLNIWQMITEDLLHLIKTDESMDREKILQHLEQSHTKTISSIETFNQRLDNLDKGE